MNKKVLATAMVVIGLFPSLLFGQLYRMDVDVQEAGVQKVIDRVFTGNTVGLDVGFYDGGDPLVVTNWTMLFRYYDSQYSTNPPVQIAGVASSNRVAFDSTTNLFYSANENYYFSISGVDSIGRKRTFARGRMIEEYDPGTSGSGGFSSNGVYFISWGNIYGDPASNSNLVDFIEEYAGADSVARAIAIWASNAAAWSSNNFSNVWARGDSVTNAVDATARAGVTSNAASIAELGSNTVGIGGGSVTGTFTAPLMGFGTDTPSNSFATPFGTSAVAAHGKGGAIVVEREYAGMYGSNAISALGYDMRNQGEANLWLNGSWSPSISNYNRATVLFGRGDKFIDDAIGWSISFRPPGTSTHDGFDQLAIFEGPSAGTPGIAAKRFGIFPTGAVVVVYGNGNTGSTPPLSTKQPEPGAALTVYGTEEEAKIAAIGSYLGSATARGSVVIGAGGGVRTILRSGGSEYGFEIVQSNIWATNTALSISKFGMVSMGNATITNLTLSSIALGTNAAVSDWPASGGGIDASAATGIAQTVSASANKPAAVATVADGTVTLAATGTAWSVVAGASDVATNWVFTGDDTNALTVYALSLELSTNVFSWPSPITNSTTTTTNTFFLYRWPGGAWQLN